MQGPVYDVDRNHHFEQLMVHAQELKNLEGPVYDIDRKHQFQELITHAYELKNLQGPVLMADGANKYVPDKPVHEDLPELNRPVFQGKHCERKYRSFNTVKLKSSRTIAHLI